MADALVSIDIENTFKKQADTLRRNLTKSEHDKFYGRVAQKVGVVAESHIADPPVRKARKLPLVYQRTLVSGKTIQSAFKTQKQQGKVFAMIKKGEIPYVRGQGKSERLLQSMSSKAERNGNNWRVIVGTDVSYGPLVKGDPEDQAPIHEGVWSPLSEDLGSNEALADYERTVETELDGYVNGLLGSQ